MLKNYSNIEVDRFGNKHYLNDEGEDHRLDRPAIEYSDGSKFWFINGNSHRNIDPSYEFSSGGKQWWFKEKLHRIGGSFSSKQKWWYIHGREYTKQEYFNIVWNI